MIPRPDLTFVLLRPAAQQFQRPGSRPDLTFVLFAISLLAQVGCGGVPDEVLPVPAAGGPFASSQVKPPADASRGALEPLPRDSARLARQQAYFAALAAGKAGSKAKALGPTAKPLAAGVRDLRAGALPHLRLVVPAGKTVQLEPRNLSKGGDTVIHLWSLARRRQVAMDDDGGAGSGASRVRYTASETEELVALVRAYAGADDGRCDLLLDGQVRRSSVRFGGAVVPVAAGRTLHAVLINDRAGDQPWPPWPRAATDTLLLLLDPTTGALRALDDDSGVELGSRLASGAAAWAMVGAFRAQDEGSARLVVNDAGVKDTDRDGLGDGLERALCTCAAAGEAACGFSCKGATPTDTDGDGLADAEEVLGMDHATFPQLLPRWGVDPRHKDLLVEIDLAQYVDAKKHPPVKHFGRTLSTADAHAAARVFARLSGMDNPDGAEGIRLHLDVGHACGALPSGIDAVCGEMCAHGRDGKRRCGQNIYKGNALVRRDNLSAPRVRRFHLAIADCLVAGSAPVLSDNLEFDCDRYTAMVHELGHNLGLARHYGTLETGGGNCKPNYRSLMNYAYSDRYYGGREVTFSDGSLKGKGDLNPLDMNETTPFGGKDADVGWLATRPFFYDLYDCASPGKGCKVDFNRDGRLDPSVRAYLSPMPNYGWICENIHGNALDSENIDGLQVSGGVAAAEMKRAGGSAPAVHVFAPSSSGGKAQLQVSYTFKGHKGWSKWQKLGDPVLRADAQPAAVAVSDGGGQRIHVVACVDGADPLRQIVLRDGGAAPAWKKVPGQPAGLRARDASLIRVGTDVLLVVRDASAAGGDLVYQTLLGPAGWSGTFSRVTAEGAPLRSTVTPALAVGPRGLVYLVSGDPEPPVGTGPVGRLHLYRQSSAGLPLALEDEELNGLHFADGVPSLEHVPWSRPAMAFVPHLDGKGQPLSDGRGYLSIWWNRGTRTRHLWTWGRLDKTSAAFTLGRWHHYEAFGYTDAITGSGPALALRQGRRLAAFIAQADRFPLKVRHIPHADGIPDKAVHFRDHDDRPTLRDGLCPSLHWDCRERCKDMTRSCGKGATTVTSRPDLRCALPTWDAP